MREPIDVQEAFEKLTRAVFDLQQAFECVSGFVLAKVEGDSSGDFAGLAEALDRHAVECGRARAAIGGSDASPNKHIAALAEAMREVANGGPRRTFGVIDGGKSDEPA